MVSIREFRRLPKGRRREIIEAVEDPLTRQIMATAFLCYGRRSWVQVAMYIGGGNSWEGVRKRVLRELARL